MLSGIYKVARSVKKPEEHRSSTSMLKAERVWVLLRLSRRSSLDDETIYPPTCEPQARANVFEFKVGHLLDNFLGRKTVC